MPRTLTAFYDSREHAEQARKQLLDAGIKKEDIDISAETGEQTASGRGGGFIESVKHFFMPEEDRRAYAQSMAGGGAVLMVRVPEGQEERIIHILDQSGAVDFDERQRALAQQGDQRRPQRGGQAASENDEVAVPVAEERLRVGKREVDRGTVRVRSYVTEHPVTEEVQLRDEHVNVERRPVGDRVTGSPEGIFEERTFEVSERGEEPVVGKETVVTEEVRVTKEADERTEKIEDTVRRTDVEVDDERRRRGERGSDDAQPRPPR
jgi:uncharacterized protein (TIGR02271 family)